MSTLSKPIVKLHPFKRTPIVLLIVKSNLTFAPFSVEKINVDNLRKTVELIKLTAELLNGKLVA